MKSVPSGKRLRVAIATELDWPLRRHYELAGGVQQYAADHGGWELDVTRFPEVQIESGIHYDGIVGRIEKDTYETGRRLGIPIVNVMEGSPVKHQLVNVLVDFRGAGIMAVEHLIKRGISKILVVHLRGKLGKPAYFESMRNYAEQQGVEFRVCGLMRNVEEKNDRWRRAAELLKKAVAGWSPPVGLFTPSDNATRLVMRLLGDCGWKVPHDLVAVGAGNEETTCTTVQPTLTSLDMGHYQQGYQAAAVLNDLMSGKPGPASTVITPPKGLVVRESSDVFQVRDSEVQKALRFMADHADKEVGVMDVVSETSLSRQILERRFRAALDTSIYKELHRMRYERAKRLLVEQVDIPVKQISSLCGFNSTSNFFTGFKRHTGFTPAAYRDTHTDPHRW